MQKFWGISKGKMISYPEAFFLVERLSNIGKIVRPQKIEAQIALLKESGIENKHFKENVEKLFKDSVSKELLTWNASNPLNSAAQSYLKT